MKENDSDDNEYVRKKTEEYADYDAPEMTKAIQIRFPKWLYDKISERAKREHRSFNGEVVYSLEKYFVSDASVKMSADDTRDFLTHLLYPESLPK